MNGLRITTTITQKALKFIPRLAIITVKLLENKKKKGSFRKKRKKSSGRKF